MSRAILDTLREQAKAIGELQGPIDVPEFGEASDVYWKPLNLTQRDEVLALLQDGKIMEASVVALIHAARDGDGKPLFVKAERKELLRFMPADLLNRLMEDMRLMETQPSEADTGN